MKLNLDCIRDILLDVEKRSNFSNVTAYVDKQDFESLKKYSHEEIMYHIRQCDSNSFFLGNVTYFMDGGCIVNDLSPLGHEFLANIRKDTNWNKTKEVAQSVGSFSLNIIKDIAAQVVTNLVSTQLGK